MAPPADVYTNPVDQWIRREYTASIVLVELRPKNVSDVKDRWDTVSPIARAGATKRKERPELCQKYLRATGFIVKVDHSGTWVVTVAHMLQNLFSKEDPIQKDLIHKLYGAWVLCDHCEQRFLRERHDNPDAERDYTPAVVVELDCKRDLLLLRMKRGELRARCVHRHPIIPIAPSFPKPFVRVTMLSWPWGGHRTSVTGLTSHHSRDLHILSEDDEHGYEMTLSEVNIASDFGSSGAPLISGQGEFVGVLQSGNVVFSYFISLHDVTTTLTQWGK